MSLGTDDLHVGNTSTGDLLISAGSELTNGKAEIGFDTGSAGGVTVTGAGTKWTNFGSVHVGRSGTGTLDITDGAMVINGLGVLGLDAGVTGTVMVSGANSAWTNSSSLNVGSSGNGVLSIQAGGVVSNVNGTLGAAGFSTSIATVTGVGSAWMNSGELTVGSGPNHQARMVIQDGGAVSNTRAYIGLLNGTANPSVTVTGPGSTWTNDGLLYVGYFGNASLDIEAGGVVSSSTGRIGQLAASTSSVTVKGGGSQWNSTSNMLVGFEGSGSLDIEAGGAVQNFSGFVGFSVGSTGTATVTGSGSTWTNNQNLYVGGGTTAQGGAGTLNVLDSGLVDVADTVKIWNPGTATLNGGSIVATSFDHTDGGTFDFLGGTLSVDSFLGTLDQDGGTLAPGSSPGITTVSADYNLNAGSLAIEIGGLTPGSGHDQVSVTGALNLGPTSVLDVSLINAYTPLNGDSFDILGFGSITGNFSTMNLPTLGGDLDWDTSNLLIDGTLSVISATLPGDLDGDGFVGINDLNIVLGNWNQNVPPANPLADPSGDGFVGIDDLNAVLGNWNAGTPPIGGAAIPEPTTLVVLSLGVTLLLRRCRATICV